MSTGGGSLSGRHPSTLPGFEDPAGFNRLPPGGQRWPQGPVANSSDFTTMGYQNASYQGANGSTAYGRQDIVTGYQQVDQRVVGYQQVEMPPVQAVPLQMVEAQPVQYVQYMEQMPVQVYPLHMMAPQYVSEYETFEPPPQEWEEEPVEPRREKKAVQRSAPPPPPEQEPEEMNLRREKKKVQRAAAPAAAVPKEPNHKVEIRKVEVEVDKLQIIPTEREIVYYEVKPKERTVTSDRVKENVREFTSQVPQLVERIITKDVPVANIVKRDKIVEKVTVKEVYVDKVVTREIPVPVERVVTKEVPVYVDKVVDRIVYKEVFVDKVVTKEVPYEVEKIEYREVQVPVDKYVDKVIEVPYDKIVFQDKVVYHDKIVYHDKEVEVPIDRYVYVEPKLVPAQLLPRTITPVRYDYTDFSPNTSPRTSMTHQNGPTRMVNVPPVQLSSSGYIMPHSTTLNGSYKPVRHVGLGLVLRKDETNQVFVKEVIPGFGAQRQGGVEVNDVIISVDGKSVEGMDLEDIKHLTIGHEGSVAQLVLRRRDETMSVRLQRIQGDMGVLGDYIGQQGP